MVVESRNKQLPELCKNFSCYVILLFLKLPMTWQFVTEVRFTRIPVKRWGLLYYFLYCPLKYLNINLLLCHFEIAVSQPMFFKNHQLLVNWFLVHLTSVDGCFISTLNVLMFLTIVPGWRKESRPRRQLQRQEQTTWSLILMRLRPLWMGWIRLVSVLMHSQFWCNLDVSGRR